MSFVSIKFITFFVILIILLKLIRGNKQHQIILLVASYIFYISWSWEFLVLLILMSIIMWKLALIIQKKKDSNKNSKLVLFTGIGVALITLGFFKYYNFFIDTFTSVFNLNINTLKIIMPLGISFYTFQAISYIADVYLGKMKASKSILKVLLYISFFPQIISGPIVKAHDFFPQLEEEKIITTDRLSYGLQRFVVGAFKKVVIADRLAVCVNCIYSAPNAYSGLSLMFGAISYALQIYYDFSGYSDMAIGIGHILGYDLGENFNLPYLSKNPSEFWRRWHISLSSWFRDYVYIPLGGSRKGKFKTYVNIFITMILSGLWHGANWSFVLWGAIHGFGQIIHKFFKEIGEKLHIQMTNKFIRKIIIILSILLNNVFVTLLWIPFKLENFELSVSVVKRILFMSDGINYAYTYTIIFLVMLVIIQIIAALKNNRNNLWKPLDLRKFKSKIILCTFILFIIAFAHIGDSAFIYANF